MITLIASVVVNPNSPKYYIGDDENLIVRIPADMVQFKKYTMGKKIIMGYNTYKTVGPLPGRKMYVLTHKRLEFIGEGSVSFVNYVDFAKLAKLNEEIVVCGGGTVYNQAIPFANKLRLTWIEVYPTDSYIGNKYFPNINDYGKWRVSAAGDEIRVAPNKLFKSNDITIDNIKILEFERIN